MAASPDGSLAFRHKTANHDGKVVRWWRVGGRGETGVEGREVMGLFVYKSSTNGE